MKTVVKKYSELTVPEFYECMRSRAEIFVVEQDCVYQDCDDCDYEYHVFFWEDDSESVNGGRVHAYLRLYNIEEEPLTVQMGRVLSLEHGNGLGGRILEEGIRVAGDVMKADRLFIEAETYVIGYYEKYGFRQISGEFLKDDIPHVQMELWFR